MKERARASESWLQFTIVSEVITFKNRQRDRQKKMIGLIPVMH